MPRIRILAAFFLLSLSALCACSSFDRADDAAAAKTRMIGMSRQDVLACMGPAKKKAREDTVEVWSYLSTDYSGGTSSTTGSLGHISQSAGSHDRNFCTVNIVMKNGVVTAVNYNGPTGGLFTKDEQCGFAVANCVNAAHIAE